MNVAIWLLFGLLALPLAEIAVFVLVALWAGFNWALLGIVTGCLAGALLLRLAGARMARIRVVLGDQRLTALEDDGSGTMLLLAGILLLVPGFITDVIALALLIGPIRRTLAAQVLRAAGRGAKRDDGVVDLEPEQWRRMPPETLSDRRERDPPN